MQELTEEHRAAMGPWADKWIKIGLCTDRADWDTFEPNAIKCYEFAGLAAPQAVVRCSSPVVAVRIAAALEWGIVHGGVKYMVNHPGTKVWDDPQEAFEHILGLKNEITEELLRPVMERAYAARIGGQLWASWLARESFVHQVCKIKTGKEKEAEAYRLAQMSVNFWYTYRSFICASDRPAEIHLQQVAERGWGSHRLHCETGPAIRWLDGFAMYALEGVRIPWELRHVVEDPEKITLDEISAEPNAEMRRIMTQRFGMGRYLLETGATLVDVGYEKDMPGSAPRAIIEDKDKRRWFSVTDGSTGRTYFLPSDPEDPRTVRALHESISGMDEDTFVAKS